MGSFLRPLLTLTSCVAVFGALVLRLTHERQTALTAESHQGVRERILDLLAEAGSVARSANFSAPPTGVVLAVSQYKQRAIRYELSKRVTSPGASDADFIGIDERSGLNFSGIEKTGMVATRLKSGVPLLRLAVRVSDQLVNVAEVNLDSFTRQMLGIAGARTAWITSSGIVLASNSPDYFGDLAPVRDREDFQIHSAIEPESSIITETPAWSTLGLAREFGPVLLLFLMSLGLFYVSTRGQKTRGITIPEQSAPETREIRAKTKTKTKTKSAPPAPAPVTHAEAPAAEPTQAVLPESAQVVVQLVSLDREAPPDFEEAVAGLVHGLGGSFSRQSDTNWIIAWGLVAPSPDDGDRALECANEIQKLAPKDSRVRILLHFTEIEGSDVNAAASRELLPELSTLGVGGGSLFVTEAFNRLLPGKVRSEAVQEDSKLFRVKSIKNAAGKTVSVVENIHEKRPKTRPPTREISVVEQPKEEVSQVSYQSFAPEHDSATASMTRDPAASSALSKASFANLKSGKPAREKTLTGHITEEVDLTQVPLDDGGKDDGGENAA